MPVIDVNGQRISYSDTGHGAPVVFVPGLAGSGEWFHYQAVGLADRFRVITYDLRRARGEYSLDVLVNDLDRLLLALRLYNAAVVGYSLGGMVALKYASLRPERLPGVVLCSTAPSYAQQADSDLISTYFPEGLKIEGFWERLWSRLTRRQVSETKTDAPHQFLAETASNLDISTLNMRLKIMRETDLSSVLPEIEVPALIVASLGDPPFVMSGSQALYEGLPDSSLEVMEIEDRFYFYTRHDLFNALLADYLTKMIARF